MNTKFRRIVRGILLLIVALGLVGLIAFYVIVFTPVKTTFLHDVIAARQEANAASQAGQPKPVMMIFSASWCGPCLAMKNESWTDEQVIALLKQTVTPVYVDTDEQAGAKWMSQYGVASLPTMIVTTPDGKILQWHTGYMNKDEIIELLTSFVGGVQSHLE